LKNINTIKAFGSALLIFSCFIIILILSVYSLSEDKNEAEKSTALHIIYQSIGTLGGFSTAEGTITITKTISVINDSIDKPDIEAIINCYTNTNATHFRDYLRAVNFSMGQFCKVQKNLKTTSAPHQHNSDRCTEPKSIMMNTNELEKLTRQYTGDFTTDIARCKASVIPMN